VACLVGGSVPVTGAPTEAPGTTEAETFTAREPQGVVAVLCCRELSLSVLSGFGGSSRHRDSEDEREGRRGGAAGAPEAPGPALGEMRAVAHRTSGRGRLGAGAVLMASLTADLDCAACGALWLDFKTSAACCALEVWYSVLKWGAECWWCPFLRPPQVGADRAASCGVGAARCHGWTNFIMARMSRCLAGGKRRGGGQDIRLSPGMRTGHLAAVAALLGVSSLTCCASAHDRSLRRAGVAASQGEGWGLTDRIRLYVRHGEARGAERRLAPDDVAVTQTQRLNLTQPPGAVSVSPDGKVRAGRG
jgi:hypothetical protein